MSIDREALEAATLIMEQVKKDHLGGDIQLKAKIQCIVYDFLKPDHLASYLASNVDRKQLSDAEFRQVVRIALCANGGLDD